MKGWKGIVVVAITLWISAALQQSMVNRLSLFGMEPDFLLISLACLAMFYDRSGACIIGFLTGALYGAIDFANLTHYVISRTTAGFCAGWSKELNLQGTILVAAVTTALTTVFARLVQMFLVPPSLITPFLGATIRTAVYNGVLAVPVYLLLKRVMGPSPR